MAKIEFPRELVDKAYQAFSAAKESGKVRKGTNETTKAIERKSALLVAVADDVQPAEVIAHLPVLCNEKDIPVIHVPSKADLGKAAGLSVGTASAAIVEAGNAKSIVDDVVGKLKDLKSGKKPVAAEKPASKPAEKKPEVKKEAKPAEKKPEKAPEQKAPEAKK